ncbi:putative SAM-dependent methyltransferase [Saccharopolyspora lacisalsi]|uniref:Putative SAM-dependent methyltransferase n=1 Tax=Halosaccharopolyspora lacisalsi TaxID=1000566 RepID=A0A839E1Q8_9PSEU|nr:methyltransferase domain-containing protein [Halosaccharopolyspora lacisalsi]MBA8826476.1 putative SAM-dependent methyltransferase [Halosaccharopolyspora lacisalsi]
MNPRSWTKAPRRGVARGFRRSRVRAYFVSTSTPKLHLGAGHNHLDGWLNTDRDVDSGAVLLDVSRPFPLPSEAFHSVFSEHLVEHLPYATGVAMLRECRRVLAPGGRIRTATPDLHALVSLVDGTGGQVGRRYASWLADSYFPDADGEAATFALNQVMRGWGHRFVYDEATLRATLEQVGFTDVRRCSPRDSAHPDLAGLEDHGVADGNAELARFETMSLEARRP